MARADYKAIQTSGAFAGLVIQVVCIGEGGWTNYQIEGRV